MTERRCSACTLLGMTPAEREALELFVHALAARGLRAIDLIRRGRAEPHDPDVRKLEAFAAMRRGTCTKCGRSYPHPELG